MKYLEIFRKPVNFAWKSRPLICICHVPGVMCLNVHLFTFVFNKCGIAPFHVIRVLENISYHIIILKPNGNQHDIHVFHVKCCVYMVSDKNRK